MSRDMAVHAIVLISGRNSRDEAVDVSSIRYTGGGQNSVSGEMLDRPRIIMGARK
jgi:hypothetical protein